MVTPHNLAFKSCLDVMPSEDQELSDDELSEDEPVPLGFVDLIVLALVRVFCADVHFKIFRSSHNFKQKPK